MNLDNTAPRVISGSIPTVLEIIIQITPIVPLSRHTAIKAPINPKIIKIFLILLTPSNSIKIIHIKYKASLIFKNKLALIKYKLLYTIGLY